jgi:exonuclease VII large subunit
LSTLQQKLNTLKARLDATSPCRTLLRGYTITRKQKDHQIITGADLVDRGDIISTETADGEFTSQILDKGNTVS